MSTFFLFPPHFPFPPPALSERAPSHIFSRPPPPPPPSPHPHPLCWGRGVERRSLFFFHLHIFICLCTCNNISNAEKKDQEKKPHTPCAIRSLSDFRRSTHTFPPPPFSLSFSSPGVHAFTYFSRFVVLFPLSSSRPPPQLPSTPPPNFLPSTPPPTFPCVLLLHLLLISISPHNNTSTKKKPTPPCQDDSFSPHLHTPPPTSFYPPR